MPTKRQQRPQLINPHLGLVQEQLRAIGQKGGRDLERQADHLRRQDRLPTNPVPVRGNLLDGTATRGLLGVLEDLGFIEDHVEDVGGFGVREFPYASLIQPHSPRLHYTYSVGSDVSSSSNTVTPAQALVGDFAVETGKYWSALVVGFLNMRHDANGSARLNLRVEGVDYLGGAVSIYSGSYTTFRICQLVTDIPGEQTVDVTLQYRPSSAGTVTASMPTVLAYAWRQE